MGGYMNHSQAKLINSVFYKVLNFATRIYDRCLTFQKSSCLTLIRSIGLGCCVAYREEIQLRYFLLACYFDERILRLDRANLSLQIFARNQPGGVNETRSLASLVPRSFVILSAIN